MQEGWGVIKELLTVEMLQVDKRWISRFLPTCDYIYDVIQEGDRRALIGLYTGLILGASTLEEARSSCQGEIPLTDTELSVLIHVFKDILVEVEKIDESE